MQAVIPLAPSLLTLAMLASCGSPPRQPSVDESGKRPANSATELELQVCKSHLQNTRLLAMESGRQTDATAAALAHMAARQQALSALQPAGNTQAKGNSVYSVRFGFASASVDIPPDLAQLLIDEAKAAPLVVLRGRTDGDTASAAESRVARERATAVRDYLVAAGVELSRIRATYQPSGDHVVENTDATGRALNRRVEIEIYRALPIAHGTSGGQR